MTLRATSFARAGFVMEQPWDTVHLEAQERHLRRKLITLASGAEVLVDFEKPVQLKDGDCLVLEDGRLLRIAALPEDLLEVRGQDVTHLARLAWHIGNRHLEAQIEAERILIRPDHVIAGMLEGLGARITPVRETFSPESGAYAHAH
jgi:urease accessory protein